MVVRLDGVVVASRLLWVVVSGIGCCGVMMVVYVGGRPARWWLKRGLALGYLRVSVRLCGLSVRVVGLARSDGCE